MAKLLRNGSPLPMPTGAVMRAKRLDSENAVLDALEYKEGDPIPTELKELIARQKQAAQDDIASAEMELAKSDRAPLVYKEPIPLDKLPPDKRAELQQVFADMTAQEKAARANAAKLNLSQFSPQMQSALRPVWQEIMALSQDGAPATPPPPSPPAAPPAPPVAAKQPEPEPDHSEFETDLTAYIAAKFASPPQLFVKRYTVLGGRLLLEFREPRPVRELVYPDSTAQFAEKWLCHTLQRVGADDLSEVPPGERGAAIDSLPVVAESWGLKEVILGRGMEFKELLENLAGASSDPAVFRNADHR